MTKPDEESEGRDGLEGQLFSLAKLFLRLGATAFGGPAAHIAMLRDEVVDKRGWVDDARFLDLLGATNLIPGPNSTEMALHIGYVRAGWRGLILSGLSFILPAVVMVGALAWTYVRFGTTPELQGILYGVKPVVIALIGTALWKLGRRAVKNLWLGILGVTVFLLYSLGVGELVLLFGSGVLALVSMSLRGRPHEDRPTTPLPFAIPVSLTALIESVNLTTLFLTFLKIGSVLYGSGYVLLAFLHSDFVIRLGWLTDQQLVDAVAMGQVTPGPVFTTATFIGYLLAGVPGAILATCAIFAPSFLFVSLTNPLIPRLRQSRWAQGFLDGVNVSALGLMAGVTVILARETFVDPITPLLALLALVLNLRVTVSTTWLVLGGAGVGLARFLLM